MCPCGCYTLNVITVVPLTGHFGGPPLGSGVEGVWVPTWDKANKTRERTTAEPQLKED